MKYVKKPIRVEAFRYDGDFQDRNGKYYVPNWAVKAFLEGKLFFRASGNLGGELFLKDNYKIQHINVGDYVIKGVNGEIYGCPSNVFQTTYSKMSDYIWDRPWGILMMVLGIVLLLQVLIVNPLVNIFNLPSFYLYIPLGVLAGIFYLMFGVLLYKK